MNPNVSSSERLRRRYYRIVNGFYAVGILSLLLGLFFGFELIGSVVYLLGIVGGVGSSIYLDRRWSVTLSDERDRRNVERASFVAVSIFAGVGLAVFPVLFVLDAAGHYTFSPVVVGVLYAFGAFGLLWGACFLLVKRYR